MNLKFSRKTFATLFILQMLMVANIFADSMTQSVTVESNDVKLSVEYQKSYPDSDTVVIKTIIENLSDHDIGIVRASQIHGVRIVLIGPGGTRVNTLPYSLDSKFRFFDKIKRYDKSEGEIVLAGCFPFETVGEYRCRITRRVYNTSMLNANETSLRNRGTPIDLLAPEFTFRVESVNQNERSADEPHPGMLQGDVLEGFGGHSREEQASPRDAPPKHPGDSSNAVSSHHSSVGGGLTNSKESKIVYLRNWWWVILLLPVLFLVWLVIRRISRK